MSTQQFPIYDLHIHSSWSDGEDSLDKILKQAIAKKIKGLAVCDHNAISPHMDQFLLQAKKYSIEIIEGIEISTQLPIKGERKISLHILGYSFNFNKNFLHKNLQATIRGYQERGKKILQKCQKLGLSLPYAKIKGSSQTFYLSRNTIAEAISKSLDISFRRALDIAFVRNNEDWFLNPFQAVSLIRKSGGIPVLAHPGKSINLLTQSASKSIFEELVRCGLKGIEVFHPSHGDSDVQYLSSLAKEHRLLITGGTDYHGLHRPPFKKIGESGISDKHFTKIRKILEKTRKI